MDDPIPFNEAVRRLDSKSPVGSALRSSEWAEVPLALRERAQFSSTVTSLEAMSAIQEKLGAAVDFKGREGAFMDKSKFVAEMRQVMQDTGMATGTGGLTDPGSRRRLGLIYDFQMEDGNEFGRWKMGNQPALLRAFPARELIRVAPRDKKRNWKARWTANQGELYGGRMIALKDDPIWTAISRFGRPWPPFDWGSGMGVREVSRKEAIELGVIAEDTPPPEPPEKAFNAEMERSITQLKPDQRQFLKDSFGDQVILSDDRAAWVGSGRVLEDAYREALDNPAAKGEILLGRPEPKIQAEYQLGANAQKVITPDTLRHIAAQHGAESRAGQISLTAKEARFLSAAMDFPAEIRPAPDRHQKTGEQRKEHIFPINGVGDLHVIVRYTANRISPVTAWIRKNEPLD